MDIQEKLSQNNFYLLFTIIIMSILHLYITIDPSISMCVQSVACIYIGATRSLLSY